MGFTEYSRVRKLVENISRFTKFPVPDPNEYIVIVPHSRLEEHHAILGTGGDRITAKPRLLHKRHLQFYMFLCNKISSLGCNLQRTCGKVNLKNFDICEKRMSN